MQYLVALALLLVYFLFLPMVPYFALFSERFAFLEKGYINDLYFHCTYDYVKIESNDSIINLNAFENSTIDLQNDSVLSESRSDKVYWYIFVVLCVASSLFGYWLVLLCPAFKLCAKWKRRLSALDCCSWKLWTVSSIVALILVMTAFVLAMEPKRTCRTEVVRLYKKSHGEGDIVITDSEIGYCLWYLIAVAILNVLIIGICVCLRHEDDDGVRQPFRHSFHRIATAHKPLTRRTDDSYRCEHCKDIGYVRGRCCFSKRRCCPVCTSWEELDAF